MNILMYLKVFNFQNIILHHKSLMHTYIPGYDIIDIHIDNVQQYHHACHSNPSVHELSYAVKPFILVSQ